MSKNRAVFFTLCFALGLVSSFATDTETPPSPAPRFYIAEVEYQVMGSTSRPYLAEYLNISVGETFADEKALAAFLLDKERLITGNRVFDKSSALRYELFGPPDIEPRPVRVLVAVKDSWNSLVLPLVKYSTGEGLSFALRFRDFNFLGRLEPLGIDLDYYFEKQSLLVGAYFTWFQRMLNAKWALAISGDLSWQIPDQASLNGGVGLSTRYSFPFETNKTLEWYVSPLLFYGYDRGENLQTLKGGTETGIASLLGIPWNVAFKSYIVYQPEKYSAPYLSGDLGAAATFNLFHLATLGIVKLRPSAGLFATFGLDGVSSMDAGPRVGASLDLNAVDWVGNLRRGLSFSLGSDFAYHWITAKPSDLFDMSMRLELAGFLAPLPALGLEFRFFGRWAGTWSFLGETSNFDWGEYLRGVKIPLYGDLGFMANFQVPVNLAQGNFFDADSLAAEVFFIPFVDAGILRPSPAAEFFEGDNLWLCSGFDLVVFPLRARAFAYRFSAGYDVTDYLRKGQFALDKVEVKLGLGLHF